MDSAPPKSSRDEGDVPSQTKNGGDKRLGEYGYDQLPISNIKRIHPAQYHRHFLAQGIRADGRKISDFRRLDIRTDTISRCVGSSTVRLGRTTVVCGIKAEIATSNPLRGDEGYFGMRFADTGVTCTNLEISEAVNVNVPSACSGSAETKSPSDISVFATQYITDLIESSKIIDSKCLCIKPDKSAWILYADISCIDYQGNIIDSSIIALMAALINLKLPEAVYDETVDSVTVISNERRRINLLKGLLVPATIGVFDDKYIVADPVVEEESMCAITSIVTDGKDRIYGVIKYSGRGVDQDAQRKVMQRAKLRTSELLVQLEKINTGNRWKE